MAELHALWTFHSVSYGYDDIQGIKCDRLFYAINTQKMRVVPFGKFFFSKHIVNVLSYCFFITSKQICHLALCQPHCLILRFTSS